MTWTDEEAAAGRRKGAAVRNVDPTAGVALYPRRICCPRCGFVKGTTKDSPRPGPCRDCADVLKEEAPEIRAAWRAAA